MSGPPERPLADLKVLDLTRVMAGPYASRLLSDLGADVVKLEPPEGDITRIWGHKQHGLSGFYTQQNAGKRNVCVDLKADEGPALVRRLAGKADLLLENFRPGVMDRLGLGYAQLSAENPRLIMLSVSGFGQQSPHAHRPAYAPVIHAESGYIARQAEQDGNVPADPVFSLADSYSALHGVVGLLSALHMRERTGRGQHVDISMLRTFLVTDDYMHHVLDDAPIDRLGGQVFDAPGGPLLISAQWKMLWFLAKRHFGVTAEDADSPEARNQNRQRAVRRWIESYVDRDALKRDLDRVELPWGDVLTSAEASASPALANVEVFGEVDDRAGGRRRVAQAPYAFSDATSGVRGPAPRRGEHNADVLEAWLGLSGSEIGRLERSGVLLREDTGP